MNLKLITSKLIMYFLFSIMIYSCNSKDSKSYFNNSKNIKKNMSINDVMKIMNSAPYHIFDIENKAVDSTLRLKFYYYDEKEGLNIVILFNDSLKVKSVGFDD